MPHPPESLYSFTIPSIHDDTPLDCRIYHPDALSDALWNASEPEAPWQARGIVIAHPYAPMGGSYEDRIVGLVANEFLKAGWIVGTFNFRGAHGSKGRTSWSGRPELQDYTSFAAFFMHYISYLRPHPAPNAVFKSDQSPSSPQSSHSEPLARQPLETPTIILGGYSYGSLILKHLPPIPTILQPFASPITGSANDEIILRACKLSDQSNLAWINLTRSQKREKRSRRGHKPRSSLTMGGEETTPEKRRASRDIRRSIDGGLGADLGNKLRSLSHRGRKDNSPITSVEKVERVAITMPEVWYLLISPLTPPVSTLLAPSLGHKFWSRAQEGEVVISKHRTLAIYGGQDIFTSAKRIQDWSEQIKAKAGSQFSSIEVVEAGHFWVESGVEEELTGALKKWESGSR
ncbi:hypothetical protein GQ44DRAFT_649922 [Phaeosphaeriaceae sp. PMI808]|nr:hypothetical protein GQ44DRAFT_649922 [Phaeosphaeriaceae sp. PMI808]